MCVFFLSSTCSTEAAPFHMCVMKAWKISEEKKKYVTKAIYANHGVTRKNYRLEQTWREKSKETTKPSKYSIFISLVDELSPHSIFHWVTRYLSVHFIIQWSNIHAFVWQLSVTRTLLLLVLFSFSLDFLLYFFSFRKLRFPRRICSFSFACFSIFILVCYGFGFKFILDWLCRN